MEEAGSSKLRREHGNDSVDTGVGAATQLDLPGSSNHEQDHAATAKVWLVLAQAKLRLVYGSATVRRATFLAVAVISVALVIATNATCSSSSLTGSRQPSTTYDESGELLRAAGVAQRHPGCIFHFQRPPAWCLAL
ncbi:hypothetical protein MRX96_021476 [Rhipicephalus microplus]